MNKPLRFSIAAISALLSLLFIIYILPFIAIFLYLAVQPLTGFTGYEGTRPLLGSTVQSSELYYTDQDKFVRDYHYQQKYTSGVSVTSSRGGGKLESCKDRKEWYIPWNRSCEEGDLKKGKYVVTTSSKEGKVTDIFVEAQIGGTSVYVKISDSKLSEFADYGGWQEYFDTMKPKSLWFMPYKYKPSPLRAG